MKYLPLLTVVAAWLWIAPDASAQSRRDSWSGVVRLPPVESEGTSEFRCPSTNPGVYGTLPEQAVRPAAAFLPESGVDGPSTLDYAPPAYTPSVGAPGTVGRIPDQAGFNSPAPLQPGPVPEPGAAVNVPVGQGAPAPDGVALVPQHFQPTWYVSASGLFLTRADHPHGIWVSQDALNESNLLMQTENDFGWRGWG